MKRITKMIRATDHVATGKAAREEREALGITLVEMATLMSPDATVEKLAQLEAGQLEWDRYLIWEWNHTLKQIQQKRKKTKVI